MISDKLGGESFPVFFLILYPVETFLSDVHFYPVFIFYIDNVELNDIFCEERKTILLLKTYHH